MMLDPRTVARALGSAPRPRRRGRPPAQPATIVIVVQPVDRLGRFRACFDGRVVVASSHQPFVDSARVLIAEGQDPNSVLEMWHAGSDHFALRALIGVAAQFDVVDRARGTAFVRRTPPTDGCASSQNSPAGCADEAGATVAPLEPEDATSDDGCAKPARTGESATATHRARRADGRHNAAKDKSPP